MINLEAIRSAKLRHVKAKDVHDASSPKLVQELDNAGEVLLYLYFSF